MTICPHCSNSIDSVLIRKIDGIDSKNRKHRCTAYTCPTCNCVLSVVADPLKLRDETITAVKAAAPRR